MKKSRRMPDAHHREAAERTEQTGFRLFSVHAVSAMLRAAVKLLFLFQTLVSTNLQSSGRRSRPPTHEGRAQGAVEWARTQARASPCASTRPHAGPGVSHESRTQRSPSIRARTHRCGPQRLCSLNPDTIAAVPSLCRSPRDPPTARTYSARVTRQCPGAISRRRSSPRLPAAPPPS